MRSPAATDVVLVLVDEDDHLLVLELALGLPGYELVRVTDPGVALDLAHRRQPALVILEEERAGPAGFELCRELREDPRYGGPNVVVLAARAPLPGHTARDASNIVGCTVLDPFDADWLVGRVRAILAARTQRKASDAPITLSAWTPPRYRRARLALAAAVAILLPLALTFGPATAGPGEVLWEPRVRLEALRLALAPDEEARASLHARLASERLGDLAQLVADDDEEPALVDRVSDELDEHFAAAAEGDGRVRGQLRRQLGMLSGLTNTTCADGSLACPRLQASLVANAQALGQELIPPPDHPAVPVAPASPSPDATAAPASPPATEETPAQAPPSDPAPVVATPSADPTPSPVDPTPSPEPPSSTSESEDAPPQPDVLVTDPVPGPPAEAGS